jgi:subtilisin family serine protease
MWRVFGCTGQVTDDIIIKALLMAYEAKVDVISLSLGGSSNWEEQVSSVVADRIVGMGVPVVIAASNSGSDGIGQVGSPGTGRRVTTVASFDNSNYLTPYFTVDVIKNSKFPYVLSAHASDKMPDGNLAASATTSTVTNDACNGSPIANVAGKIALVRRGMCTFDEKSVNAAKAGAIGMLVYDNNGGDAFSPSTTINTIPVAGMSAADGLAIFQALQKGAVKGTFFTEVSPAPISTADTVSSFSSVGPLNENQFKPNIAGVGGQVFSTLPLYLGGYGTYSGTSMATPYVSGSIALFLEANGKHQQPQYILEQFQNHAHIAPVHNGIDGLDSPIRQGAGLIQVVDTIKDVGHITPAQISFNDTANLVKSVTLKVSNRGKTAITYTISNNQSMAVSPYNVASTGYTPRAPIAYTTDVATLRLSARKITVKPGKTVSVRVSVIPPKTNPKDHIHYGGFVQFKASNGAKTLNVPYFGVVGNNKDLPLFDSGFPGLYSADLSTEYSGNQTYVLDRNNLNSTSPAIVFRLLSGTALIEAQVLNEKKEIVGYSETDLVFLPRHTMETGAQYSVTTWQGSYIPKGFKQTGASIAAPGGYYYIKFRALKQLGNPAKNADYEIWTSPRIQLKN